MMDSTSRSHRVATPVESKRIATEKAQRKRRRFWILFAFAVLVVLPAAAYFGLIAYINFGFVNSNVASQISALFGTPAHVGEIKTQWLKNLRIDVGFIIFLMRSYSPNRIPNTEFPVAWRL